MLPIDVDVGLRVKLWWTTEEEKFGSVWHPVSDISHQAILQGPEGSGEYIHTAHASSG